MPKDRLLWPDATRGLGVVAVVLFHTLIWNFQPLGSPSSASGGIWSDIDMILGRTRMPVLFALSGLLASQGILRGWARGTVLRRVASSYYLYLVWLVLYAVFFWAIPPTPVTPAANPPFFAQLALPNTTLWFIFALALYPLIIVGLQALRVPTWGVGVVGVAAWAAGTWGDLWFAGDKLAHNFLFFAIGVYLGPLLRRIPDLRWPWVVTFVASFGILTRLGMVLPSSWATEPVVLATNLTAIPAMISVIAVLCRIKPFATAGRYIGTRTLHIYVLHIPVLSLLTFVTIDSATIRALLSGSKLLDMAYPILIATVCVALSLLVGNLLDWLTRGRAFALPRPVSDWLIHREQKHRTQTVAEATTH